jgi:hypothetical protein
MEVVQAQVQGGGMRMLRSHGVLAAIAVVAVLVLAGGLWASSRQPSLPVERDRALEIAHDYYTSPDAHGTGTKVNTVHVSGGDLAYPDGKAAWKINVVGTVTEPGGVTYESAMWLYVDATTGQVTIFAQG